MEELKPCPFCGGAAKIVWTVEDKKGKYGYVRCGNDFPKCCAVQTNEVLLEEAIEAWNRRVS